MTSKPLIAVFADKDSKQAEEIAKAIDSESGKALVFDIQQGKPESKVYVKNQSLFFGDCDFSNINALHIRCTSPKTLPTLPPVLNAYTFNNYRTSFFREQEYNAALGSFFKAFELRGDLVINPLDSAYIDHDSKAQFYAKLNDNGFIVPKTIATNSLKDAKKFIDEHGEVIIKPAIGIGSARMIAPEIMEIFDDISVCPILMQQRIKGSTIRIHVVAGKVVLALRIISDDMIDSRTATKGFEFIKLSEEAEKMIVKATAFLKLHYAAWDGLLSDDDGRIYLLDCNPGPYVMWIGEENRKFVFTQLARYMICFAKYRNLAAAANVVEVMDK